MLYYLSGDGPIYRNRSNNQPQREGEYRMSERMRIEVGIAMKDTAIEKGIQELF